MARPGTQSRFFKLCLSVLLAGGLLACSQENGNPGSDSLVAGNSGEDKWSADRAEPGKDPYGVKGEWQLIAIDRQELSRGGTPTVVFGDEGNCWGNTGINNFTTTFSLENTEKGKVKLGNAAVTRKAGPPEAMALENLFLNRFQNANSYEVEGDLLHLYSGETENLTFRRVY